MIAFVPRDEPMINSFFVLFFPLIRVLIKSTTLPHLAHPASLVTHQEFLFSLVFLCRFVPFWFSFFLSFWLKTEDLYLKKKRIFHEQNEFKQKKMAETSSVTKLPFRSKSSSHHSKKFVSFIQFCNRIKKVVLEFSAHYYLFIYFSRYFQLLFLLSKNFFFFST